MPDFTPLHPEATLWQPDIDEVRDFTALIIHIRDQHDRGISVAFQRYLLYMKSDESYAIDTLADLIRNAGAPLHWLYEANGSELLERFRQRNPHLHPEWHVRHYVIVTQSDVIDVLAIEPPIVSTRTDDVRGWIRPGETRSE